MRIIFFGSPDFAVATLDALIKNGQKIVAVVTATDKLGGRGGKEILQTAVKKYALAHNLPILQPERLKHADFIATLRALNADIQVVVAFRMLPEVVWDMPRLGTFNLHASLLPKYRGAAPINWAIINGEKETGVTTFKLQHAIDSGDIAKQKIVPIVDEDNFGTLYTKLMTIGAELMVETLHDIQEGNQHYFSQQEASITHAPKIFHEICVVEFNAPAHAVHNFIRGFYPVPLAYTYIDNKEVKLAPVSPVLENHSFEPGTIEIDKKQMRIYCQDGFVVIHSLKMEGKKWLTPVELFNGYTIKEMKVTSKPIPNA